MKQITTYLSTLPAGERDAFAARCGTTVGYLRKAVSISQRLGEGLCIAIERESARAITVEQLRPDVDWAYIRNTKPATALDSAVVVAITEGGRNAVA